ncbi:uncharacterized protein HD556DRAFT_361347 [Suillus plorans]|uniref:Uncharacterized protein n=1 Tax=Suillus plorans TaxID=116603 RepID=A0A9P7AVQ1_9AGAM|nr:uncharacterized protein HD556DRAFT_361347 [Suillus plorans]KAG1796062.1 hypothetical protein HD556DRAFT_361347 [Suillus plorans]
MDPDLDRDDMIRETRITKFHFRQSVEASPCRTLKSYHAQGASYATAASAAATAVTTAAVPPVRIKYTLLSSRHLLLVLQTSHGLEPAPIPYMFTHALRVTVRRHRDSQKYFRSASQSDSSAYNVVFFSFQRQSRALSQPVTSATFLRFLGSPWDFVTCRFRGAGVCCSTLLLSLEPGSR